MLNRARATRYSARMTSATFILNGQTRHLPDDDPRESLLRWLRRERLAGTKEGCGDGDCGACTVAMIELDVDGTPRWQAVNSCLLPLGALAGREVLTVEALADGEKLHPVQQALVDCAGSQCGYCTPGFVMSLFVAQQNGVRGDEAIEGNLCRCTGYRPIRIAAEQLPTAPIDVPRLRATAHGMPAAAALGEFFSPDSIEAALALRQAHPQASWIAGATDLGVELSRGRRVASAFIALDRIAELQRIERRDDAVRIGAGVSLSRVEHELPGEFPALDQMLPWFAARQVRNRATFGGNLGSASPIGDLLPVLLAYDATIELRGTAGPREIAAAQFFLDYRRTARAPDELIVAVRLPRDAALLSAGYKVAKRQTDDISIVAAAFALRRDAQGGVSEVRLAYGGVAAIPRRASAVEAFLQGRRLDAATVAEAAQRLAAEFTPLDDHRASADYRRALCGSLFAKFVAERLA
jgi:xanthine dehydrogenase small subunit